MITFLRHPAIPASPIAASQAHVTRKRWGGVSLAELAALSGGRRCKWLISYRCDQVLPGYCWILALHSSMALSVYRVRRLSINSTNDPLGPKPRDRCLMSAPSCGDGSSWSTRPRGELVEPSTRGDGGSSQGCCALDTLGPGDSVTWTWQLKTCVGSFQWPAGIMAALFSCFRELQILKQRHVSRGNTAAAQQRREGPLP